MRIHIFYSWQSETAQEYNKHFIGEALRDAVKILKERNKTIEFADLYLDRDTEGIPGFPNIPTTIDAKIRNCQIFIADLTITNRVGLKRQFSRYASQYVSKKIQDQLFGRPTANSNVLIELGKASMTAQSTGIVTLFNEHYHNFEGAMPFDIAQNRKPICYTYSDGYKRKEESIKKKVVESLVQKLQEVVDERVKNPQFDNYPFLEWERWGYELSPATTIPFEANDELKSIMASILKLSKKEQSVVRIVGLSGIGKTRLVYETFNPQLELVSLDKTGQVLYLDLNTNQDFRQVLTSLSENSERKVIVADNCNSAARNQLMSLVKKVTSRLSLITIDHNVPVSELDRDPDIPTIEIFQKTFEPIIDVILRNAFPNPEDSEELTLIKDFAQGHILIATMLSDSKRKNGRNWRPIIQRSGVLDRLLGEFGSAPDNRKILRAISIFDKLGHYDELSVQTDFVANSSLITNINTADKASTFREVCLHFIKTGVMERQARFVIVRAKPVALSLAIEWWEKCDPQLAQQVFDSLSEHPILKEALAEQLKYLDFLDNAREIVENFVKPKGPFGIAEVLNTEEGSRLFRALVEVNPQACTAAMARIFLTQTTAELKRFDRGRRNIVWALEKLCFRSDTFNTAARVLMALAISENENAIVNNATGQFLHLFQAFLPGTQADYQQRIDLIESALGTSETQELALSALKRGLKSRDFHRTVGAENQGSAVPLRDYPTNEKEALNVDNYWTYCIEKLLEFVVADGIYAQIARTSLINALRGFFSIRKGYLIIPAIKRLLERELDEWIELRNQLKLVVRFDSENLNIKERETIDDFLSKLERGDFESLYTLYVASPSWDEDDSSQSNIERTQALAKEFLNDQSKQGRMPILLQGKQENGRYFGEQLAHDLDDSARPDFFTTWIDTLKTIADENRNLTVLAGFISAINDPSEKHLYLKSLKERITISEYIDVVAFVKAPVQTFNELTQLLTQDETIMPSFLRFQYGRALDHLKPIEVIKLLEAISNCGLAGARTALMVLFMYSYNREDLWESISAFAHELVLKKGLLLSTGEFPFDKHKWAEFCDRFLINDDVELAKHLIDEIVALCQSDKFVSVLDYELKAVLKKLVTKYFQTIWPTLSDALLANGDHILGYMNLRGLLTAHIGSFGNDKGILADGDTSEILLWCRNHSDIAPGRAVHMSPVFDVQNQGKWHPFTKVLIDEFGDSEDFLNHLDANLHSFSWTGSIVPLLKQQKAIVSELTNHRFERVRKWAIELINELDERIRKERNFDKELMM